MIHVKHGAMHLTQVEFDAKYSDGHEVKHVDYIKNLPVRHDVQLLAVPVH